LTVTIFMFSQSIYYELSQNDHMEKSLGFHRFLNCLNLKNYLIGDIIIYGKILFKSFFLTD